MPALEPYTQEQINAFGIVELGVRGGSSSPTLNLDLNGSIAIREYLCHWSKWPDVVRYFAGDQDTYTDSGSVKISRLTPRKMPGRPEFVVTKILDVSGHAWRDFDPGAPDYEGSYPNYPEADPEEGEEENAWGGPLRDYEYTDETINVYQCAKIKVQYEIVPYEVEDDQHVADESMRFVQYVPVGSEVQYLTVPSSTQQHIVQGGVVDPVTKKGTPYPHAVPVPYPVGLTETIYRFELILHRWPFDAWGPGSVLYARIFGNGTDRPYLNAVNKTTFWEGSFVRGTCMFEGVEDSLDLSQLDFAHKYCWKIKLKFAVNPYGWNTQWAFPNSNEWAGAANQAVRTLVGRGNTWYDDADVPDGYSNFVVRELSDLFNPGPL